MHRLTDRTVRGEVFIPECFLSECRGEGSSAKCDNCEVTKNIFNTLAAYEDTGITPEQLKEIDKMYLEKCEEVNRLKVELLEKMEQLTKYEDLEERLEKMFNGELPLKDYVDELERYLSDREHPSPLIARILTYEDAEEWDEYKRARDNGLLLRLPYLQGNYVFHSLNGKIKMSGYSNPVFAEMTYKAMLQEAESRMNKGKEEAEQALGEISKEQAKNPHDITNGWSNTIKKMTGQEE